MMVIIIYILIAIAGLCSGLMDAIKSHDAYRKLGHFWSRDSWADLYDSNYTIGEKVMNAAINAWHVAKWTMVLCFIISIVLAPYLMPIEGLGIACMHLLLLNFVFIGGFHITYK